MGGEGERYRINQIAAGVEASSTLVRVSDASAGLGFSV